MIQAYKYNTYNKSVDKYFWHNDFNNDCNDCINNPTNSYTYIKPFSSGTIISNIDDEKHNSHRLKGKNYCTSAIA